MKHNLLSIIAALTLMVAATACTVIPEDDRIITETTPFGNKSVLLVEFTGWKCVNCPDAAKVAHQLLELHGDNLVVVGIHPDGASWCIPTGAALDFRTEVGGKYWTYFGSPVSFPIGIIDFCAFNGDYLLDRNLWAADVAKRRTLYQSIFLNPEMELDGRDLSIHTNLITFSDTTVTEPLSLILWITEDNIVGLQLEGSEPNLEYVHNHVLRAAATPEWGNDVTAPAGGAPTSLDATITLDENWVINNCNVVAVLINKSTKEVLSVRQVSLSTLSNNEGGEENPGEGGEEGGEENPEEGGEEGTEE